MMPEAIPISFAAPAVVATTDPMAAP